MKIITEKYNKNFLEYKKSVENFNRDINNKKIKSESFIMENLRPLLSDYAKKNNISMIINKQNIIIGKTELDITDEIIKSLNNTIKEIKLEN